MGIGIGMIEITQSRFEELIKEEAAVEKLRILYTDIQYPDADETRRALGIKHVAGVEKDE